MGEEMATKRDLEELIIRVDERTKVIPNIESHLRELNGIISDTIVKLAKTSEIAENAKECADKTSKHFNELIIGIVFIFIIAILSLGLPQWLN